MNMCYFQTFNYVLLGFSEGEDKLRFEERQNWGRGCLTLNSPYGLSFANRCVLQEHMWWRKFAECYN
jgi:hypothetical protein